MAPGKVEARDLRATGGRGAVKKPPKSLAETYLWPLGPLFSLDSTQGSQTVWPGLLSC